MQWRIIASNLPGPVTAVAVVLHRADPYTGRDGAPAAGGQAGPAGVLDECGVGLHPGVQPGDLPR